MSIHIWGKKNNPQHLNNCTYPYGWILGFLNANGHCLVVCLVSDWRNSFCTKNSVHLIAPLTLSYLSSYTPLSFPGICIPVQPHLPATVIAHSLSSNEFVDALEIMSIKAIRHAQHLNAHNRNYDRENDDIKKILSTCVADELQKTYHITTK